MSIESELKKNGITVIKKLDKEKEQTICKSISNKICTAFPDIGFNKEELYSKLTKLNMYIAKIPDGMSEANYFYKNSSIYFNEKIHFDDLDEFAIHETIHYLQEQKNNKNELLRMGLCNFSGIKVKGLGINEAAVQFTTSKIIGISKDFVKYYNIEFQACSPSYYPLECNLIEQMSLITGTDVLYDSTFFSNDNFKNAFISKTTSKTYSQLQTIFDNLLEFQEKIIILSNVILETPDNNKNKIGKLRDEIQSYKILIKQDYFNAQNIIISNYFNNLISSNSTLEDLVKCRKKLEQYKELVGSSSDYTFFNDFYNNKMAELETKSSLLENNISELDQNCTAIAKTSKFLTLLNKLRSILAKPFSNVFNK